MSVIGLAAVCSGVSGSGIPRARPCVMSLRRGSIHRSKNQGVFVKYPKMVALATVAAAAMSMAACSNDDDSDSSNAASSSTSSSASETAVPTDVPTAAELNEVLARATDPAIPAAEKVDTVQDGAAAPELFDVMTQSKEESGATFEVVDPVLPDYTPDAVLATVLYTLPDREPQTAERVQFVHEDGQWKLSRSWACTLVRNTVPPEQVPAVCQEEGAAPLTIEETPESDEIQDAPPADAANEADAIEE